MKKRTSFIFSSTFVMVSILVMSLALVGCGNDKSKSNDVTNAAVSGQQVTEGVSSNQSNNGKDAKVSGKNKKADVNVKDANKSDSDDINNLVNDSKGKKNKKKKGSSTKKNSSKKSNNKNSNKKNSSKNKGKKKGNFVVKDSDDDEEFGPLIDG